MDSKNKTSLIIVVAIGIIIIPIILNAILQISNSKISVIGDEINWLSFWGSYIGSIIGGLITLYVLSKTLKQNEQSNTASQNLQLNILKAQLKQSWLDNLIIDLKSNVNPINLFELIDSVYNINANPQKAEDYFSREMVRTVSKPIEFKLHFDEKVIDDVENGYLELYKEIVINYSALIEFLNRTLSLMKNTSTFENAVIFLHSQQEMDRLRQMEVLTEQELRKLISADEKEGYLRNLNEIIQLRFIAFSAFYEEKQLALLAITQVLVEHERNKLMSELK